MRLPRQRTYSEIRWPKPEPRSVTCNDQVEDKPTEIKETVRKAGRDLAEVKRSMFSERMVSVTCCQEDQKRKTENTFWL